MKKVLFFLLCIPFLSFAKFYQGKVYLNNRETKVGLLEIPDYDDSKLVFKLTDNDKTEKIISDEVAFIEIIIKNETFKYFPLKTGNIGIFNHDKLTIQKQKIWYQLIKEGKISLFAINYSYVRNGGPTRKFFVKRENNDYCMYIMDSYDGNNVVINAFDNVKKIIAIYFKKDCPKLEGLLDPKDLAKNGIGRIVELYEQNCGK